MSSTRFAKNLKALNITILNLQPGMLNGLRPVTSLENFEASTQNFHPDGLFSIDIFGRIGSEARDSTFSYIDIKIPILHPFIVEMLQKVKGIYLGILMGRTFAKWNEETKDFEQSDEMHGDTGYAFFMEHFKHMNFEPQGTKIRDIRLKVIHEYQKIGIYDKILVLPAGMRDAEVDEFGQLTDNEINEKYRRILSIANTIPAGAKGPVYDRSRASLHIAFSDLFQLFSDMIGGRDKMIQKRVNYRRVHNGTRNVITAMDTSVRELGDPTNLTINHTQVGLFQAAKSILPVCCYHLRTGILGECFQGTAHGKARLINPDTLKSEIIDIGAKDIEAWSTTEGMEKFISDFAVKENRHKPVVIGGYYAALVYLDEGVYKVFYDIDDMPDSFDRKKVAPITVIELLYLSMGPKWGHYISQVTRFPVAGDGSTYPSSLYCMTTITTDKRSPLNESWEPEEDISLKVTEYPRVRGIDPDDIQYFDTMAPHTSRHSGLAADHDGDMMSCNTSYDETALKATKQQMLKRDFYVTPGGALRNSPIEFVAELTLSNMG